MMLRSLILLSLGAGLSVRAVPGQTATQRLRVEEAPIGSAEATRTTEPSERARAMIGRGNYDAARRLADDARGFRVVVSLDDRVMWVLHDNDTLRTASVGIASGETLDYAGRSWTFRTPRGKRTVLGSRANPVWTPPDWAYAETASQYNLKLAWLSANQPVTLRDGRRLTVQNSNVGLLDVDGVFRPLPRDEHIVFESTLYIPPHGTVQRHVRGQLGPYVVDMGGGYLFHGGPAGDSLAPTHGCIRLTDADLEWLYKNVEKGTAVYIY